MHFLIRLLITAIVFYCLPFIVPGIHVASPVAALIAALIFGLLNAVVRPVLVILTLPVTVLTLGLFMVVLNALLFWLVAVLYHGIRIENFMSALIGAIIMMVVGFITTQIFKQEKPAATTRP